MWRRLFSVGITHQSVYPQEGLDLLRIQGYSRQFLLYRLQLNYPTHAIYKPLQSGLGICSLKYEQMFLYKLRVWYTLHSERAVPSESDGVEGGIP